MSRAMREPPAIRFTELVSFAITNPNWPTLDAMIVLDAGTDEARLGDFLLWLGQRSDVTLAAIPRLGNETYVPDLRAPG